MSTQPKIIVAVVGSTGVVGRAIIDKGSHDHRISQVIAITRRPYFNETSNPPFNQSIKEEIVEDLHSIKSETFANVDAVYCALGPNRSAGDDTEDYSKRVLNERDLIIKCATTAREAGVKSFSLVSGLGADPSSRFVLARGKGEAEQAIKQLNFPHCALFRPVGLYPGKYQRPNPPLSERIFLSMMNHMPGLNRSKWANTPVELVATAMINDTFANMNQSVTVFEGMKEIVNMAKASPISEQIANHTSA